MKITLETQKSVISAMVQSKLDDILEEIETTNELIVKWTAPGALYLGDVNVKKSYVKELSEQAEALALQLALISGHTSDSIHLEMEV